MRHALVGLAAVGSALLTLSGCAGEVLTVGPARSAPAVHIGAPNADPATANRAAARRDAVGLLKRLRLPAGAVRLRLEPSGDNGYLKLSGELDGDSAHATAAGWWTIEEPPSAVIAYLGGHRPAGSTASGTGSAGNSHTGTSASILTFAWLPRGNVLGERQLQVTVTVLTDGKTGIFAEAQSDWTVLRSWSERVPAGVSSVQVTLQRAPKRIGLTKLGRVSHAVIRAPRAVARAISLVDSLDVLQPVVLMCPMEAEPAGSLTVTYSAGPAGPALAQAKVLLFPGGQDGGAGECDPIGFSIRGHTEKALIGAPFAKTIEKLAGFRTESRVRRPAFGPGPVVIPTAQAH